MIKVILNNGTECTLAEWQKIYGLPVGSANIGRFFSLNDPKIAQNYREHGYLTIVEPLIRVADLAREKDGEGWTVNSFNRTDGDQKRLHETGFKAATVSPHVVSMAMDVGCAKYDTIEKDGKKLQVFSLEKTKAEVFDKVAKLQAAAKELGIKIRIGYREYMAMASPMYFVHFDVCPMYYGPGMPYHAHTHPAVWEAVVTW